MDHPDADCFGLVDAVDVLHRPGVDGQRQSYHPTPRRSLSAIDGLLFWLFMWRCSQAAEHIYLLTVIFTSLVVIAATQGKGNYSHSGGREF